MEMPPRLPGVPISKQKGERVVEIGWIISTQRSGFGITMVNPASKAFISILQC
jgi:TnpA family transposase